MLNARIILVPLFFCLFVPLSFFPILTKSRLEGSIPLIALYPYSVEMTYLDTTKFMNSLNLTIYIGFKGVKLGNIECFYHDTDNGSLNLGNRLSLAVQNITERGLEVIVPLFWYNGLDYSFPYPAEAYSVEQREKFPSNETLLNWFCDFCFNVSRLLSKEKVKVNRYAIHYPFNWLNLTKWKGIAESLEYENALRKIIKSVYDGSEGLTPIYLVSELMEYRGVDLPKNFEYVSGYGFQPYSLQSYGFPIDPETINETQIKWLYDYWNNTKKDVYVDEWGYRTHGIYEHGLTQSEYWKEKLIREMIEYLNKMTIVWCYFGLYDFPPENADWGIAYFDNSLKPSGLAMKEMLAVKPEYLWYVNPITYGTTILLVFISIIILFYYMHEKIKHKLEP